jgi:putative (di)nucleoside polyphosphate hydrolase
MSDEADSLRIEGYRPGVGVVLLDPMNRVFVGRRIDIAGDNWQMPQGGIDKGETPRQAAMRELKEEVGTDKAEIIAESTRWLSYEVPSDVTRRLWRGRYRGQRQKWFAMRFLGHDEEIDLRTHYPEFDAWKWVPPADLPRLIVPFKRQLYLDVLAEFDDILRAA